LVASEPRAGLEVTPSTGGSEQWPGYQVGDLNLDRCHDCPGGCRACAGRIDQDGKDDSLIEGQAATPAHTGTLTLTWRSTASWLRAGAGMEVAHRAHCWVVLAIFPATVAVGWLFSLVIERPLAVDIHDPGAVLRFSP